MGGVRFDPTITLGHIIMAAAALVPLIVWGVRLEGRVDNESQLRVRMEQQYERDGARDAATINEVKGSLRRIEDKMDNVLLARPRVAQ